MDIAEETKIPSDNLAASAFKAADGDFFALIEYREGELHNIVDQAERAIIDSREQIYQRGSSIVRVVRRDAISARRFKRAAGAMGLVMVEPAYLVDLLTRIARWMRWDKRTNAWRSINCPDKVALTYLSRLGRWNVPRLWGATDAPTLRSDGSILQTPGYDEATGILFDPGETLYPTIIDQPTLEDAGAAFETLCSAIDSFPFDSPVDRSVALALILTALVRRSLPAAPLGAITAPIMGSGKTLLADLIAIIATGVSAPVMGHPATEEEASKLLLALLGEGDSVVLIDNIERPLEGAWLCAVLTAESFSARRLGGNTMAQVPTSTLWLATGNSLQLQGDLRTRALLCRIDPRMERPEEREFAVDLREDIARRRPELVVAGLTLMRAFVVCGKNPLEYVHPWGRFEKWSDLVRASLVWIGCADPCASLAKLEADDPERMRHIALLRAWLDKFDGHAISVRDAIDAAMNDQGLREAMELVCRDRSGQLDAARLGKWLRRMMGRIADGAEFVRAGERQGSALWSVRGKLKAST